MAAVRQPLIAHAEAHEDTRVLADSYMSLKQAMAAPKDRIHAAAFLRSFVDELKTSGTIADILKANGQSPMLACD